MLNAIPTTEQVITQVQCEACGKPMSDNTLKYSHAGQCIKRVQELYQPKAIPVPKKVIPKSKILPVNGAKPDEESDDDEAEFV